MSGYSHNHWQLFANRPTFGSIGLTGTGRIFQSPAGGPGRGRVGGWATDGVGAGGNPALNYNFQLRLTCFLGCKDVIIFLLILDLYYLFLVRSNGLCICTMDGTHRKSCLVMGMPR